MPLPSSLSYLGIAKEATKGTAVNPTDFIPVDPASLKPLDKQMYLEDAALRGAMVDVYNEIQGPLYSQFEFGGPVYADTFGYIAAGLTGDLTVTGASAPFTHACSIKNTGDGQPKSYTLTDFYAFTGTHSRQYAGMQFLDTTLKFTGDGLLEHTTKATGFASALVAKPAQSFTAVEAIAGWRGAITIAGGGVTYLIDGTLNIKRSGGPINTVDGTANPYSIWVGTMSVDGTVNFLIEDDAELIRYLTNTKPSFVVDYTAGAGAALVQVKVVMSTCAYTEAGAYDRSGDYVKMSMKIKGVGNTTDVGSTGGYGNAKLTIQSAKPSGTYA